MLQFVQACKCVGQKLFKDLLENEHWMCACVCVCMEALDVVFVIASENHNNCSEYLHSN